MDRSRIDQYEQGGATLRAAVRGLGQDDLLAYPVPGTWSIQQIVIHLMDSDLIATDRMKRIIAEENPTIIGFDESCFAGNLFYHEQSVADAVAIFDLNRRQFAKVLRKLPDAAFERKGTHNQAGVLKLGVMIETYVDHLEHHLRFLYEKRAKLGKAL